MRIDFFRGTNLNVPFLTNELNSRSIAAVRSASSQAYVKDHGKWKFQTFFFERKVVSADIVAAVKNDVNVPHPRN